MIHVLICDDHAVVRRGLGAILTARHGMKVVGEATNGMEAVELAAKLRPDVILMDLLMPVMNGVEAIGEIVQDNPQARILVLTSFGEDAKILAALQAGAAGYVLKDSTPEELLAALRAVAQEDGWLPAEMAEKLAELQASKKELTVPVPGVLSDREREVLIGLAQGLSNAEIAEQLDVTINTVRTHARNIYLKLGLENRLQAALYARNFHLILEE